MNPIALALKSGITAFQVGWQIGKLLFGSGAATTWQTVVQMLNTLIISAMTGILTVFNSEYAAVYNAQAPASQIGRDLETIETQWQNNFTQLLDDIIPDSLGHLRDTIKGSSSSQFKAETERITASIAAVNKILIPVQRYVDNTVKPDVAKYNTFISTFTKTDAPAIKTLVTWLAKPGALARFATPAILTELIRELSLKSNATKRGELSLQMTSAWLDTQQATWNVILEWFVA